MPYLSNASCHSFQVFPAQLRHRIIGVVDAIFQSRVLSATVRDQQHFCKVREHDSNNCWIDAMYHISYIYTYMIIHIYIYDYIYIVICPLAIHVPLVPPVTCAPSSCTPSFLEAQDLKLRGFIRRVQKSHISAWGARRRSQGASQV